ncbi:MAG: hypothetical protein IH620_03465, partial [Ignavibacterium sp.]|nr:hypothetical protein [Ignavibacterium sp.]
MKSALNNKYALLALDSAIILFCLFGLYLNYIKATLPFSINTLEDNLIITSLTQDEIDLSVGDTLLLIDDLNFSNWEEAELYLDGKNIGDKVQLTVRSNEILNKVEVSLINHYSIFDLSIIGLVGLFFIVFAILVRIKAPENNSAKIFHLASLGLGMVIMMTAGNYTVSPFGFGYLNRILWLIAYSFTPVLFIHFTLSFVEAKDKKLRSIIIIL